MTDRVRDLCVADRCWSPIACSGWGYCRERKILNEIAAADERNWQRGEEAEKIKHASEDAK